jgi:lipopolysaccharide transport system ATP-binding protein
MSKYAIQVENLGKAYRIGLKEESPDTFMGLISNVLKAPFRNFKNLRSLDTTNADFSKEEDGIVWALKGCSFHVEFGEVLGIIGHNGAGKSTLLKLLSRITEPTKGRAVINGRVASLLEVGTGFHPELSGRDNIYMNGTILGMSKREIDRKLDEIVDFSGVEKFLDTPIKRYSSGMKVRLAFSVAAHLEPEILVIDEVLAVGDQEFQNKCLGKMGEVAKNGKTILFVSHNMAAVQVLCDRVALLSSGQLHSIGETETILSNYLDASAEDSPTDIDLSNHPGRTAGSIQVAKRLVIRNQQGLPSNQIRLGDNLMFEIHLNTPKKYQHLRIAIRIFSMIGQRVTTLHSEYQYPNRIEADGDICLTANWRNCPLMPGRYSVQIQVDNYKTCKDKISEGINFVVVDRDIFQTGRSLPSHTAVFVPTSVEWNVAMKEEFHSSSGM